MHSMAPLRSIVILAQAKELVTMRCTTNDVKNKMDDLIKQNEGKYVLT